VGSQRAIVCSIDKVRAYFVSRFRGWLQLEAKNTDSFINVGRIPVLTWDEMTRRLRLWVRTANVSLVDKSDPLGFPQIVDVTLLVEGLNL
jgi:hypothetical protein